MIYFCDASALVKRYVVEAFTTEISSLVGNHDVALSRYSLIEIGSALARRNREGMLDAATTEMLIRQMNQDVEGMLLVELTDQVTRKAQRLVQKYPLRAGDAIQLGSCLYLRDRIGKDITFVAFDNRLISAAADERLPVWCSEYESGAWE